MGSFIIQTVKNLSLYVVNQSPDRPDLRHPAPQGHAWSLQPNEVVIHPDSPTVFLSDQQAGIYTPSHSRWSAPLSMDWSMNLSVDLSVDFMGHQGDRTFRRKRSAISQSDYQSPTRAWLNRTVVMERFR
jgi:hypothetical protein